MFKTLPNDAAHQNERGNFSFRISSRPFEIRHYVGRATYDAEIRVIWNTISRNEFPSKRYCASPPKRYHRCTRRHLCPRVLNRENFGDQIQRCFDTPFSLAVFMLEFGREYGGRAMFDRRGAHYPPRERNPPINRREPGSSH